MLSSPGRYLALLLLVSALALPLRSEETPTSRQTPPAKTTSPTGKTTLPGPMPSADSKIAELKKLDFSSLPADAVLVVCERAADALRLVPDAIVLSPKKYQELLDEIARLKGALQTDKPAAPSKCYLKGKVEGNAVLLEAQFEGVTDRPNAVVALACPQAVAAAAQFDGRMPDIRRAEARDFFVQIEKPGRYQLTLNLFVPLTARTGNVRGFELTLPRTAITNLDLDLPANVKDPRIGGRSLSDPQLVGLSLKNHHLGGSLGLGAVDKLDLVWKEVRPPSGVPLLTAQGDIQVQLDAAGQTTEAKLELRIEGGQTNVWRLLVPLGAEVKAAPTDEARIKANIETANQKFAALRTIHLKESSADPLRVVVKLYSPLPRGGALAPVGPFFVVGAARQTGTLLVRNQVRDLHLDYHEHGDLKMQQLTDEALRDQAIVVAAFTYGNIPLVDKPQGFTGPASLSWLDLEAETVRSQVRTRVTHALTLRPPPSSPPGTGGDEGGGALRWDITTTIAPATKWSEVEQLKVIVPSQWKPAEEDVSVEQEKGTHFVRFRSLLREGPSQPVQLRGHYEGLLKSEGRINLILPRPQGVVEQCDVKIDGPSDSEVVVQNAEQTDLESIKQTRPNDQTWRYRHVPADGQGIDVSWGPYRPELVGKSVIDLSLHGSRGDIRHEVRLSSSQSLPASIGLRLPASAADSLRILEGGTLQVPRDASTNSKGVLRLVVPAKPGGNECRFVLHYTTDLGEKDRPPRPGVPFAVPLATPEGVTRGETKVRVWSPPGSLPLPPGGPPWDEKNIEEVKDRADLPVLVLQAPGVDAPLVLRAGEQSSAYAVLVERALVRVQLLEDGGQSYHASFQLRQLAGPYLDLEFPGPVATLNVQILLNRRKVTPDIVNDSGQQTDGGNIARLRLSPELVRQASLLDLTYFLPPGRTAGSPLRTTLPAPVLRGAPATVRTRWQVSLSSNRVLIAPESASGLERTGTFDRWLLAARLKRNTDDHEREFEESLPADLRRAPPLGAESEEPTTPALVCWQDASEPIVLTHAPRLAWLLVCSLGLLVLGLGLYGAARPRSDDSGRMAPWLWPILAVLTLGVAVGVLFWPTTLWAILYGCEPGALVLLCVLGFQWLIHQRYRRQIVFLPSFSRGRAGSSLLRKSAAPRPAKIEPSTVDAPPPA
jgi:hypothetical protein